MAAGNFAGFWTGFRERRFARRLVNELLHSYAMVHLEKPQLSRAEMYREVLLRTGEVQADEVDSFLRKAESSVDDWTAPGREGLGLREVVHYFVMSRYQAAGRLGATISFGEIVNRLVPADF